MGLQGPGPHLITSLLAWSLEAIAHFRAFVSQRQFVNVPHCPAPDEKTSPRVHPDLREVFSLMKCAAAAVRDDRFRCVRAKASNQYRLRWLSIQTAGLGFRGSKLPV